MTIQIIPQIIAYTALEQRAIQVLDNCRNGTEQSAVSKKLRIGYDAAREVIYEIRKKEGIRLAKLTNTQKAAIYQSYKDGTSQKELAIQFGVTAAAICQLVKKLEKAEMDMGIEKPEKGINPKCNDSVKAEPKKLPDVIWQALDDKISMINLDIEARESRIGELQEEIKALASEREKIREFMEAQE